MRYNSDIHHRRSIRLREYDYSLAGAYFITICCENGIHRFGKIENQQMVLNDFGKIARDEWLKLSERYPNMLFDTFQIMPNHVHGIIQICQSPPHANHCDKSLRKTSVVGAGLAPAHANHCDKSSRKTYVVGAGLAPALANHRDKCQRVVPTNDCGKCQQGRPQGSPLRRTTIGNIVGVYKSLVAIKCLEIYKLRNEYMGELWQRNYYERIIRNHRAHHDIATYITNNPINWENDEYKI
ncbi:MAG: hypothetical protein FWG79_00465 [Bacteroidales bacterium]|nr:hypothetical protein [Bacteroidales bacterium]